MPAAPYAPTSTDSVLNDKMLGPVMSKILEECQAKKLNRRSKVTFSMPKVELHAHLSGSLSMEIVHDLMNRKFDKLNKEAALSFLKHDKDADMESIFAKFPFVHQLLQTPEDVKLAMKSVISDFWAENCVYLELRTTPKETENMNYEQYIRGCLEAIETTQYETMEVFLIISFDRRMSVDTAKKIMEAVIRLRSETNLIVGVDLCGNPSVNGRHLLEIFETARSHGLGVTIHLAEVESNLEEVEEFLSYRPDRIGHGSLLHLNEKHIQMIKRAKIHLEICPTSNITSSTFKSHDESHYGFWKNHDVPVSFNTDDKGIFPNCSLTDEYLVMANEFNLSTEDLIKINRDALTASFAHKFSVVELTDTWRRIENNDMI
ncbi:unnamed protein product [Caenorhabditis sp. 36 PRJEB53466]|nr:unnamed protein product [Caenorhabditis sp. 36 PRJEB53466]